MKLAVKMCLGFLYRFSGVSISMIFPALIRTILSEIDIASSWSCVTCIAVNPFSFTRRLISYLNRFLVPAWSKRDNKKYVIKQDLTELEALQPDKKIEAPYY